MRASDKRRPHLTTCGAKVRSQGARPTSSDAGGAHRAAGGASALRRLRRPDRAHQAHAGILRLACVPQRSSAAPACSAELARFCARRLQARSRGQERWRAAWEITLGIGNASTYARSAQDASQSHPRFAQGGMDAAPRTRCEQKLGDVHQPAAGDRPRRCTCLKRCDQRAGRSPAAGWRTSPCFARSATAGRHAQTAASTTST